MKKSTIITIASVVVFVPLLLLAISINQNKAEQKTITAAAHAAQTKEGAVVPQIKKFESRSSEWGKYYQRQYDSYRQTRKSDKITDMLIRHWS
jgi:nitrite reductase (cytochrome c-552)